MNKLVGKHQILVTLKGNLLCLIQGEGFIYLKGKTLTYAPHDQHEIGRGLPLDSTEWEFLFTKAKDTHREASPKEVAAAGVAIEQRKAMLQCKSMSDRKKWVSENLEKRRILTDTPFAGLAQLLRK